MCFSLTRADGKVSVSYLEFDVKGRKECRLVGAGPNTEEVEMVTRRVNVTEAVMSEWWGVLVCPC